MKKTLVTLLALVFVLGVAGTAFAAPANPFVDVPAKHWAYGAVSKLAKAGIVDGYGDGTFRGDRTMTRYEMAQIVAKAMAKSEKADAEMKALIDKLAVEFAAELNNLGVRVSKLEEKTNFVFNMENRLRYVTDSPPSGIDKIPGSDAFEWRMRFHVNAAVNDSTTFTARIEATGTKFGGDNAAQTNVNNNSLKYNRAFFTTKNLFGIDQVRYGRIGLGFGLGQLLMYKSSDNDGVYLQTKMGETTVMATFADTSKDAAPTGNATEFGAIALGWTWDNFKFQVGYYNDTHATATAAAANSGLWNANVATGFKKMKGYEVAALTKMGDWTLTGEYVKTSLTANAGASIATGPKAYAFQITNGVNNPTIFYPGQLFIVNSKKAGTDAWALSYRKVDAYATPAGLGAFNGTAAVASGVTNGSNQANSKAWYLTYENVIAKNVVLSLEYQDIKNATSGVQMDKTFNTSVQFLF